MTNISASDLAGRRLREVRQNRGWTVKELAEKCAEAGSPHITATVITNLETRRRSTREISVDELLVLAQVLDVHPLALIVPLEAGEKLQVLPGTELDALEAVEWIAGDDYSDLFQMTAEAVPGLTDYVVRVGDRGNVLTTLRQLKIVMQQIIRDDRYSTPAYREKQPESAAGHERNLPVMADRLMHLAARMDALGYEPPGLDSVKEILQRHDLPSTLMEWRYQPAAPIDPAGDDENGGA